MAQIEVKFDNTLKQSDIIIPIQSAGEGEESEGAVEMNKSGNRLSAVTGIMSPLISVNDSAIAFNDVIEMTLDGTGPMPELSFIARDNAGNIQHIDHPGVDNEIRLQIIPPFDNAYKKINLTFYTNNIRINNGIILATGVYKVPKLISYNIKSFGEINSYDLFETIAKECGLGFATNAETDDSDKRFVYCDYKSYRDLLSRLIQFSGNPELSTKIFDYWIDYWNNLNYVDIYERYNTVDPEDDILVWISGLQNEMTYNVDVTAKQMTAVVTNHPSMSATELYASSYNIVNDGSSIYFKGSDKVLSIYENQKHEYLDHLILNGDVLRDIFTRYEYIGEAYGKFNYLLNKVKRDSYLLNLNNQIIEVTTTSPNLGLMRGHQVIFEWYFNDDKVKNKLNKLEENGLITKDSEVESNILLEATLTAEQQEGYNNSNGEWMLDKTVSGLYLIVGSKILYAGRRWIGKLLLSRPNIPKSKRTLE